MKSRSALLRALLLFPLLAPLFTLAAHLPHDGSDLPVDPTVKWGRLDNGLRYALMPNHEPKGRASLRFTVAAGSLHESDDQRGLAHFLEHMAFNGSAHFPAGTLVEYFQRLGMSFGGDTNAQTGFDRTTYLLELPDTKPETVEKAFTLFADYAGGLTLEPKEIDEERGVILSEKRERDSVEFRQFVGEFEFLLPESRFVQRIPIGTEEIIAHAPRERFVDFYNTWYRPELMTVVAVGDFDPAAVEAQLKKALAPLAARGPARAEPGRGRIDTVNGVVARLLPEPEAGAVHVSLQTITPYAHEDDNSANRLKYLPRSLALRMLNRRLSILAKQEGAPFLAGQVGASEQFDFFRNAAVELTCKPEQWRAALAVGEQELRRALQFGFQSAELKEAVAQERNNLEQAVRTASTRRSEGLAAELVSAFVDREVFTTPATELALFAPALDQITVDACLAALRGAWDDKTGRRLFVTGNLKLDDAEKQIAAAYDASRAVAVTPPAKIEEAAFAYTDFGPAGEIAKKETVADLGVTLIEFKNGVRLNLKPTDFEAGVIRVNIRIGGGKLTEPAGRTGLWFLASNSLLLGGLGQHSIDDLQRLLAGHTVGRAFGVGNDAFNFNGNTNKADLALELQLLCAYVTDPGYRPEAMRLIAKNLGPFYTRLANTVEGPLQTEVPRLLASGDPRFGVPPLPALAARTMDEVKAWLTPEFARGALEIAIVGDFDPEAATAAVAKTFGALPARGAKPAYEAARQVAFPAAPLVQQFAVPTEIPKGQVVLFWSATDARDVKLSRRLNLLSSVLSDRLRKKIREEMGGTYSPDAGTSLSDTFTGYGFFVAEAGVAPDQARVVADAVKGCAADLFAHGVTEEELVRAKQPILTSIKTSIRTNPYWLGTVLAAAQEFPQRLDWSRTRLSDTESVTAAELTALAKQYLDPAKVSEFISLPAPKPAAPATPAPASAPATPPPAPAKP
ncbi:MAG: insulinase family protein [Opitutae bacterium]|nr:insulinase family protein [Opitutae bacterium]